MKNSTTACPQRPHYSALVRIANRSDWSEKSCNNAVSVLRRAFMFGCRDHQERQDAIRELKGARIQHKDLPVIDPFILNEAEKLIAALRRDWGDAQSNHDECCLCTGLRPATQSALLISDFDSASGTLNLAKARVDGLGKDSTKTGDDRRITFDVCERSGC